MGLETAANGYISELNILNPTSTDPRSQGDDHLRLIKRVLQTTFPNVAGVINASHAELNQLKAQLTYGQVHVISLTSGTLTTTWQSWTTIGSDVPDTSVFNGTLSNGGANSGIIVGETGQYDVDCSISVGLTDPTLSVIGGIMVNTTVAENTEVLVANQGGGFLNVRTRTIMSLTATNVVYGALKLVTGSTTASYSQGKLIIRRIS